MEDITTKEKKIESKTFFKRSNIEKTFFTSIILFSLYCFYPLFLMQINFLFVPNYTNKYVSLKAIDMRVDYVFSGARDEIGLTGEVCLSHIGFTADGMDGYLKHKANYFLYPNSIKLINVEGAISEEETNHCDFIMILSLGEIALENYEMFYNRNSSIKTYSEVGGIYSLLIYKRKG